MKLTPEQILQLEDETISLCQEMIRIPSVNYGEGKGDEKAMAEYVAAKLSEVGIKSELIETAPNLSLIHI
jgi:acetylornithine deacetylase/succinyl-diaminopimelate desuccinylase-like protein